MKAWTAGRDPEKLRVRRRDSADAVDFERRLRCQSKSITQSGVERKQRLAGIEQAGHALCQEVGGLDADRLTVAGPQAADLEYCSPLADFERRGDLVVRRHLSEF